jgi:hypothetical protein
MKSSAMLSGFLGRGKSVARLTSGEDGVEGLIDRKALRGAIGSR